jgi:transcription antitermination factor NusG
VFEEYASWFALHVRMHDYHNVEKALHCKGYEVFAPTYEPPRVAARRQRRARVALFPGYLFCSLDPRQRTPVLTVPGVINILGLGSTITPVPASEIESLRRTVKSGLPLESVRLLEPGEPVEVQSGPLAGVKGAVVYHKGKYRVVITVSALNDRAVAVEVDRLALITLKDQPSTQLERLNASLLDRERFAGVDGSLVEDGRAEDSVFGSYREPTSQVVQTVG